MNPLGLTEKDVKEMKLSALRKVGVYFGISNVNTLTRAKLVRSILMKMGDTDAPIVEGVEGATEHPKSVRVQRIQDSVEGE